MAALDEFYATSNKPEVLHFTEATYNVLSPF